MLSHDEGRWPGPTHRPPAHHAEPTGAGLLALQRSLGNRAVTSVLSVQRVKLSTGQDTDDLTADQLLGLLAKATAPQQGAGQAKSFKALKSGLGKLNVKPVALKKASKPSPLTEEDIRKVLSAVAENDEAIQKADDDVMDMVDEAVGGIPPFQGTEGGYGEHGFAADSTYFEKLPKLRPAKSPTVFPAIYLQNPGKVNGPNGLPLLSQACQEPGCTLGGWVYFEAGKPWREYDMANGISLPKAPPVCHRKPYAVMAKALYTVVHEENWKTAIRPGSSGWDAMHYELAWGDINNLGPGHAACNSRTASHGRLEPTDADLKAVRAWAKSNNYVS